MTEGAERQLTEKSTFSVTMDDFPEQEGGEGKGHASSEGGPASCEPANKGNRHEVHRVQRRGRLPVPGDGQRRRRRPPRRVARRLRLPQRWLQPRLQLR